MSTSGPSLDQVKAGMRAAWMAGDFGVVAKTISQAAEEFIASLTIPVGAKVLDVACGTGNTALPLARRGCTVTGVDIAPNLLAQARERASAEGLAVQFDEGDAEALPYPDGSFDAVTTMFGAMFAPRPEVVAAELGRVLRPGGLLAMANWNPGSFTGRMFRVTTQHLAPPAGVPAPVLWGDEDTVRQRLASGFHDIHTELTALDYDMEGNAAGAVSFFRRYFGPTTMAFSRLDEARQQLFAADLEALWSSANVAPDPETHTLVRNQYLRVTAIRNG